MARSFYPQQIIMEDEAIKEETTEEQVEGEKLPEAEKTAE